MIRKKVVVVDDEKDLCDLIKRFLLDLSPEYEVHMAHNLSDGLDLIEKVKPEVLFIDNNLPDGLGWEQLDNIHVLVPKCKINLISASQYLPGDLMNRTYPLTLIEKPLRLNHLKDYL
ncbi:MAG TPA: response regulator [Chryseosolibacter sp.]|nr:response regulator [Chryseosolibacter sp.]